MSNSPITQDALDRLEKNVEKHIDALDRLVSQRFEDHERRLNETNNAHALAVTEKQKTDAAAVKIQENAVSKAEWHQWKDEVNRRLDTAAGAGKTWALIGAIGGSIIAGVVVRLFSQ